MLSMLSKFSKLHKCVMKESNEKEDCKENYNLKIYFYL